MDRQAQLKAEFTFRFFIAEKLTNIRSIIEDTHELITLAHANFKSGCCA
jgi:hypothetical protein